MSSSPAIIRSTVDFARARRPDEDHELAVGDREIHLLDGLEAIRVALCEALKLDPRHGALAEWFSASQNGPASDRYYGPAIRDAIRPSTPPRLTILLRRNPNPSAGRRGICSSPGARARLTGVHTNR
jgi:hypothetical protein